MASKINPNVHDLVQVRRALAELEKFLDNFSMADVTDLTLNGLVQSSGGGVAGASPQELIVLDNGTPNRFSAGPDGEVLTSDSAEALGMKWETRKRRVDLVSLSAPESL